MSGTGSPSSVPSVASLESEKAQADQQEEDRKKWTVMFYGSGADKNLDSQMLNQLKGIEGVGALDQVNAVVRQSSNSGFGVGNTYETKTFALENGSLAEKSQALEQGEMSDPRTLADFLEWGIKNYPAEHYAVVMGGHGAGFLGTLENQKQDELMSPVGVAAAFDKAQTDLRAAGDLAPDQKIDSVAFDSCYMGQYEVMYQMRDQTKYVIGSPEAIGAAGLDYGRILTDLKNNVNGALDDPKAFSQNVVNSSPDNSSVMTLSAVDTEQLGKMDSRFQSLSQSINRLSDSDYNTLVQSIGVAQGYGRYDGANPLYKQYYEINDVMNAIKAAPIQDQDLKGELFNEASLLQDEMAKSLVANYGNDAYKGAALSMFLPVEKLSFETTLAGYQHLDAFDSVSFLKDSQYPFEFHEMSPAMAAPQMGPAPSETNGTPPPPPVTSENSQWWVNKLVKDVVDQTASQAGVHTEGGTYTEKLAETAATVGKDQLAQNVAQAAGQQFADQVASATDKNTAGQIAGDITNALAQELTPVLGAQEAKEVAAKAAEQIVANTATVNPDSAPEVTKQVVNSVADMTVQDANNQELMAQTVDNIARETWNHTGDLGTAIKVMSVAQDAAQQKAAEQAAASQNVTTPAPEPVAMHPEPAPMISLPTALDPVSLSEMSQADVGWPAAEEAGVQLLAANLQAGPGPEGADSVRPTMWRPEDDLRPTMWRPEDSLV
ncbi:MAG: hypothetical protein HYU64_15410 [Armatimonadetes bacterium]|nr:hypothetical protein [Armatimonadota bacterium]